MSDDKVVNFPGVNAVCDNTTYQLENRKMSLEQIDDFRQRVSEGQFEAVLMIGIREPSSEALHFTYFANEAVWDRAILMVGVMETLKHRFLTVNEDNFGDYTAPEDR